ncbi:hypothetical protein Mjas_03950 [Methanothermococcus sp. Ax23]|uniref:hypothetical protein n=1 Tax=Methanothermococcus sp. Ax23 TaxID=3156486 RepID=UPI003BA3A586
MVIHKVKIKDYWLNKVDEMVSEGDLIIEVDGYLLEAFVTDSELLYALDEGKIKQNDIVEINLSVLDFYIRRVGINKKMIESLGGDHHLFIGEVKKKWTRKDILGDEIERICFDCGVVLETGWENKYGVFDELKEGSYILVIGRLDAYLP